MISAKNISLSFGEREVLRNIDFKLEGGEFVGLVGPNGSGKTSLMRALLKFVKEATGECSLWNLSEKERAKKAAWLSQDREVVWDLSVRQIVELGRTPWRTRYRKLNEYDRAAIADAIDRSDLKEYLERRFGQLSGGERARVLTARMLAQKAPFIFADEPINELDPAQQIKTMQLLQALAEEGHGVLISIHDLGLALRFCSRLILIESGEVHAEGSPLYVLNDKNLRDVFRIRAFRAESNGPIMQAVEILER